MPSSTITIEVDPVTGEIEGYLSVRQFAEELGVSSGTVRQWINRGRITPIKIGMDNYFPVGEQRPEDLRKKNIGRRKW